MLVKFFELNCNAFLWEVLLIISFVLETYWTILRRFSDTIDF